MSGTESLVLYGYWRSSASFRVRLALTLKGLEFKQRPVHLAEGQQHSEAYKTINPFEMVPTLKHGARRIHQSLAIIEYLEEAFPEPALLPYEQRARAHARATAYAIACDIHPLNNLRVLKYLEQIGLPHAERITWVQEWIHRGFGPLEQQLSESPVRGLYCEGDTPGLSDICLIPQIYNALRFKVEMTQYPTLMEIYDNCAEHSAFQASSPEKQPDAPGNE